MEIQGAGVNSLQARIENCSAKKSNASIVSSDDRLVDRLGEALSQSGIEVSRSGIEGIAEESKDLYFIDLGGFESYTIISKQVITLRQNRPDSELVLLAPPYVLSTPQLSPLKTVTGRHLVPISEKPLPEKAADYRKSIQALAEHAYKFLHQPHLIKVGGSIFDLHDEDPEILLKLLGKIKKLHSEGYPIVLTTGGGPRQDTERTVSEAYGTTADPKQVLERQAKNITQMLEGAGVYIPPEKVTAKKIQSVHQERKIPVVSLSGNTAIPYNESDTHTLAIGEMLGVYKVIFAKNTDGVYERDPNITPQKTKNGKQSPPKFFPWIYASDILNGVINRKDSEGGGEHLIETNALVYLRSTSHVRLVQIVNGRKPEMLCDAVNRRYVGSSILRG